MTLADAGNAFFEAGGSIFIWLNYWKLRKDQQVRGVLWSVQVFYTIWGYWNIYYYPALGQWFSFAAGLGVVSGNTAWTILAAKIILAERAKIDAQRWNEGRGEASPS